MCTKTLANQQNSYAACAWVDFAYSWTGTWKMQNGALHFSTFAEATGFMFNASKRCWCRYAQILLIWNQETSPPRDSFMEKFTFETIVGSSFPLESIAEYDSHNCKTDLCFTATIGWVRWRFGHNFFRQPIFPWSTGRTNRDKLDPWWIEERVRPFEGQQSLWRKWVGSRTSSTRSWRIFGGIASIIQ